MRRRSFRIYLAALVAVALGVAIGANAATYKNQALIVITDASLTLPPVAGVTTSTINVTETGPVSSVIVTLVGIEHENADDLDIALIAPDGTKVVLMSDAGADPPQTRAGRPGPLSPINPGTALTFMQGGATLPATGVIPSGTYQPADYGPSTDPFCNGESDQTGPYTTSLASFNTHQANGIWTLNIRDDCGGFTGRVRSGWCLIINTSSGPCQSTTAATVSAFSARRSGNVARLSWKTAQEAGVAGFNLYRSAVAPRAKVNRTLVAGKRMGTSRGASYAFTDRQAKPGVAYTYLLQVVRTDGTRSLAAVARLHAWS